MAGNGRYDYSIFHLKIIREVRLNGKTGYLLAALLTAAFVSVSPAGPGEAGVFSGKETGLDIKPAKTEYCLAALTGESNYYDTAFYDGYLISVGDKPAVEFTRVRGEAVDFYYYVEDAADIAFLRKFFDAHRKELDAYSELIVPSLAAYADCKPRYKEEGLHAKLGETIKKLKKVTVELIVDKKSSRSLDAVAHRYAPLPP